MLARELMRTHVTKTTPDATLSEALDLMDLYQVESLPVVDDNGRLCGIVSETNVFDIFVPFVKAEENFLAAVHREIFRRRVADVMQTPVLSVGETETVQEAAETLLRSGYKRLPITTEDDQVIGVLTRLDVMQAVSEGLV